MAEEIKVSSAMLILAHCDLNIPAFYFVSSSAELREENRGITTYLSRIRFLTDVIARRVRGIHRPGLMFAAMGAMIVPDALFGSPAMFFIFV